MNKSSIIIRYAASDIVMAVCWIGLIITRIENSRDSLLMELFAVATIVINMIVERTINRDAGLITQLHRQKAKSETFNLLYVMILVVGLISLWANYSGSGFRMDWTICVLLIIGAMHISKGAAYLKNEYIGKALARATDVDYKK